MRFCLMLLFFQFLFTACQSGEPKPKPAPAKAATVAPAVPVPAYDMKPDTIVVRGKFLQGCSIPDNIRIALHNVNDTKWMDVKVNANGEFSYKHRLTEPRRIALRTIYGVKFDFFATTREKVYQIEISCAAGPGKETFAIKGSAENDAYQAFTVANKQFQTDLDTLAKQDLSDTERFALLKKMIEEYQKTLTDIAAKNPSTFTAQMFIPMEKLPEGSLSSLEALRANFLQRDAYASPQMYNDFLPQRILMNYVAIRKYGEGADKAIETLMTIGLRNKDAATKLQGNVSNVFQSLHQEDLYIAFINWADRNPDKMYNTGVKAKLLEMKGVMAGNNYIDFQLPDSNGKMHKLSETVSKSKVTLLIFYSPGCGHCQKSVPQFIPAWEKYGGKGLGVVAVGNDATNEEWKKFIAKHAKPEWVHFLQVEGGPQPSKQYYASNPTFILIDGEGKILSRIGDVEFVKEEIERRLGH